MTAPPRRVHDGNQIVTNPRAARRSTRGGRVADEHVFTLTFEASGEVTPAAGQPEAEESPTDEEETDG